MANETRPRLSIVVLSYNRVGELARALAELGRFCREEGHEFIVVDNASMDGSREILEKAEAEFPGLVCVFNTENLGVGGGRNAGYRLAQGEWVLNLDEDAHIEAEGIRRLAELLSERPMVGIVSPIVVHEPSGEYQNHHGEGLTEVGNFHGACYMFRRKLLDEIGYLDEMCTFGGEELDFSIRARAAGYSVLYTSAAVALHNSIKRPGRVGRERMRKWLSNYVRVHFKHFPPERAAMLAARYSLSFLIAGIKAMDIWFIAEMVPTAVAAAIRGRRAYRAVPRAVADYYTSPYTRPDLGNIPVSMKILRRFYK